VIAHSANDANTSAKRRKLDTDEPPSSSTRSTRSSRPRPRPDIYTINDDEQQESSALEASNASIEESTVVETLPERETMKPPPLRTTRTPSVPLTHEEITESPVDAHCKFPFTGWTGR
jgi:hypothetical protein